MDVVLVVRVLAAVAIVVSVCCGTTALIERGRVPRCVYAALPAYTRPIVRLRGPSCVNAGKCVNAHPRCVYVRKCVYANAGCVYARGVSTHPGAYTRDSAFTRAGGAYTLRVRQVVCVYAPGCVYAGGCIYASGGCIYAAGAYTHPGAYTRVGAFTRAVVRKHSGCVSVPPRVYTGFCVYAPPTA